MPRKLEARASTVKRAAAGAGIVWSRDDPRVTRELEPGELAAADMPVAVAEGESPAVVLDASDLGFVHDAAGLVAGRMTEVDGSLVAWEGCAPGPEGTPINWRRQATAPNKPPRRRSQAGSALFRRRGILDPRPPPKP